MHKEFTAYVGERLANFACILKNIKKYFLSQDDAPIDNVLVENMFSMVPLEQCKWLWNFGQNLESREQPCIFFYP